MDSPTYDHDAPEPEPPAHPPEPQRPSAQDPLAVAFGNASLLGLGYLFLGRRRAAVAAVVGTVVLAEVSRTRAETWCEVLLLVWWAAVVAHGWYLARKGDGQVRRRGQLVAAVAATVTVVLTAGLLRLDAHGIQDDVAEARGAGDCEKAVAAQDEVGIGHRYAGAPVVAEGDATVEACERLELARTELSKGGRGEPAALARGFGLFSDVLAKSGNEATTKAALDDFLNDLSGTETCEAVTVTDWLRDRKPSRNLLDKSADSAEQQAPAALLGCANSLMDQGSWERARQRYERLLDEFPDDERAGKAKSGVQKAVLAWELDNVTELVDEATDNDSGYCANPAKYGGAPAPRKGGSRVLFLGDDEYTDRLPGDWSTDDPTKAALVLCAGEADFGDVVQSCDYEYEGSGIVKPIPVYPNTGPAANIQTVTFHKIKVPVKVYELRTGKLVSKRDVQIRGGSCPRKLSYTYYQFDTGPDEQQYVSTAKSDVREAFSGVVGR